MRSAKTEREREGQDKETTVSTFGWGFVLGTGADVGRGMEQLGTATYGGAQ
jgi:hypothetical protein